MELLRECILPALVAFLVICGTVLFGINFFNERAIKYSIECKQAGMVYQKVDGMWICK